MKKTIILFTSIFFVDLFAFAIDRFNGTVFSLISFAFRILGCCLIGLKFTQLSNGRSLNRKASLLICGIVLTLGLCYLFLSGPSIQLFWLFDHIWPGTGYEDIYDFSIHPLRVFISESLLGQQAVFSYMCLIVTFQLSRLRRARKD